MRDITAIIFLKLNLKLMNLRMQQFHFIEKSIEIFSRLCRHCARYVTTEGYYTFLIQSIIYEIYKQFDCRCNYTAGTFHYIMQHNSFFWQNYLAELLMKILHKYW